MDEMEALPRHSRGLVCEPTLLRTAYPLLCSTAVFVRAAYSLVGLPGQTLYLEPMVGRRDDETPPSVVRRPSSVVPMWVLQLKPIVSTMPMVPSLTQGDRGRRQASDVLFLSFFF